MSPTPSRRPGSSRLGPLDDDPPAPSPPGVFSMLASENKKVECVGNKFGAVPVVEIECDGLKRPRTLCIVVHGS